MSEETAVPAFNRFKSGKRTAVRLSTEDLVETGFLEEGSILPRVFRPKVEGLNPVTWAESHRELIERELLTHGALLFRDFKLDSVDGFEQFTRAISPDLLDYKERAAPRTEVHGKIYTSTEFPAEEVIPLHHEMSYSHNWPTKLWFYCAEPAVQGGATPIAPDRVVFGRIGPRIRARFIEKKVMYVRNYGEGVDLSWQQAFQTEDRAVVEEYCRRFHTQLEWRDGDRLRTRQVRQAVAVHPKTGETVWFNHAHMFHVSNLRPEVRQSLLAEFREDELPRNAFYGDGTPIESSILEEIRGIYDEAAVTFPWQRGDVLMLDNFLVSHGRRPFSGPRRILVAMAELYTNDLGS